MSGGPILTCGAGALDRDTIAAVVEEFERELHHAAAPSETDRFFNGSTPAAVFLNADGEIDAAADVCAQWKRTHPEVPIVFIAATDDMDMKMEAMAAGADQFLVSPVEEEALRFVLRFLLVEQGR